MENYIMHRFSELYLDIRVRLASVAANHLTRLSKGAAIAALAFLAILVVLYERVDARAQLDQPRRADAIIVLGSSVYPDGRASPSLAARIQSAIELYRAGYAPYLILCGGIGNNPPSEAQVMKNIALNAGVPEGALVLEDRSHSTEENLANAKTIMDSRGWHTSLIVSAPYHLLRAETLAQDLNMDAYAVPSRDRPTFTAPLVRSWYTAREAMALVWYYATLVTGQPRWLYVLLKGRI